MSGDPNKRCSRCKTIGQHHSRECTADRWPPSAEQWCDRCFSLGHDAPHCPARGPLPISCTKCGHEGHHQTQKCTLDKSKPEDLEQFIPSIRRKIEDKQKKTAPSSKTPAQHGPLSHRGPPAKSAAATSSTVASGSGSGSRSGQQPPAEHRELTVTKVDGRELPKSKEQDPQKELWAKSNLKLAEAPPSTARKTDRVKANFFKVDLETDVSLQRYQIVLDQIHGRDVNNRDARKALIHGFLTDHLPDAQIWVTDYYSEIVSVGKLYNRFADVEGEALDFTHNRNASDGTFLGQMNSRVFYKGRFKFTDLRDYVDTTRPLDPNYQPDEDLKTLNILTWKHIYANPGTRGQFETVGKKFYDRSTPRVGTLTVQQQEVYVLRNGYFSSMRPGEGSLLLNVNATTTAFYPTLTVQEWMTRRLRAVPAPPLQKLQRELQRLKVTFRGDLANPQKVWRIMSFSALDVNNTSSNVGTPAMAVLSYMRQKSQAGNLNLVLSPTAYCVKVGQMASGQPIWYPADQLTIVEWQSVKVKIEDPGMSAEMIRVAMRTPAPNQTLILGNASQPQLRNALYPLGIEHVGPQGMYQSFGLAVDRKFVTADARHLPGTALTFGNQRVLQNAPRTASWNLTGGIQFLTPPPNQTNIVHIIRIGAWSGQGVTPAIAGNLATALRDALRTYGVAINIPQVQLATPAGNANPQLRRRNFKTALDNVLQSFTPAPNLIVVSLRTSDITTYSDLKWWADSDRGVQTVSVGETAVRRATGGGGLGLLGNLCLKINFKLDGTNHRLAVPLPLKGRTMIVGADVTHPGKGDEGCPSMAGVVATCNPEAMHYLPSARLQPKNTEYIEDLYGMMKERLREYSRWTPPDGSDVFPEHILFYRDGVSESQYGMVIEEELPQIRKACEDIKDDDEPMPSITLVIVGKRHHTRFYPMDANTRPNNRPNLDPGMVVDTRVVVPKQFNFYLQSHASPIGTARTGHYVVLENGSGYTANELQGITNSICFMGSRATKGLSVCTPARYADILCDRLRMYMRPALENHNHNNPLGVPANATVNWYQQNRTVWGPQAGRDNPWHPNLDQSMFYL